MRRLVCGLVLWAAAVAVAGALYRWVDAQGRVHYTDQPPPPSAKSAEEKKLAPSVVGTDLPYAVQEAARKFPVTLYATDCGELCDRARGLLAKRAIPYAEKNAKLPAEQEALKKLTGGSLEVPVLVVGSRVLKGFLEPDWNATLDAAGYPKSPLLPSQREKIHPPRPPAQTPAPKGGTPSGEAASPPAGGAPEASPARP